MNAFRAAVEAKDLEAMRAALHPDVVFRSPAGVRTRKSNVSPVASAALGISIAVTSPAAASA